MKGEGSWSMEIPMQRFSRATTILGGFALVAMLALSSPGVRIARSADAVAAEAGEGAVCEPGDVDAAIDVTAYLEAKQRRQPEPGLEPRSDDEAIVLNNRGFNYGEVDFDFPRFVERDGR
jgi:hypothetical protein